MSGGVGVCGCVVVWVCVGMGGGVGVWVVGWVCVGGGEHEMG